MTETLPQFIGGRRVRGDASVFSLSPSNTNDVVAHVPVGAAAEIEAAAARLAQPSWADASPEVRSDLLDKVGDALDPATQIGPAVGENQMETSCRYIDIAEAEGGRLATGGQRPTLDSPDWYVQPTLITETHQDMRINCDEVSGPVASTIRVKDHEEALAVANDGAFGLSAGICTNSLKYARDFQRWTKAGMVMVNLPTAGVDYHVPFGGTRKSSYGSREQGFAAIGFYTQTKAAYSWA